MACGEFTKILYHTKVDRYMSFMNVGGSYVYKKNKSIYKIPASQSEALTSSLLNLLDKNRMRRFFEFISEYDPKEKKEKNQHDLSVMKTSELFESFSLSKDTQYIVGHCIALHINDDYLNHPAQETYERICLYMMSFSQFGNSPYIYPRYGLGELPQGFARLSAIYGGTYMLDKPVDEVLYDEEGKFCGVRSGNEIAKARICVGDPSYFPSKVKKVGQVVRKICIFKHPVNNAKSANSLQIIIPHKEVGRKNDIYVVVLSSANNVCADGFWVAIASTVVETSKPLSELDKVLDIVAPVCDQFTWVLDTYTPTNSGISDNIFISESYDATSHFESVCKDVMNLYKRMTNKELKVEVDFSRRGEDEDM